MKALFILADNVYLTPYLKFYMSLLNEIGWEYKIVYWDKNNNEIIDNIRYIRFENMGKSKFKKIIGYWRYRTFILELCTQEKFDLLIPLHAIVSFLLYKLLIKKFSKKYIYDIRDYSYENIGIFRLIEKKLTKHSIINVISSEGFKNFLPDAEYFVIHNIPRDNFDSYKQIENRYGKIVQISYIGLIRFMDQNMKIIDFFKNDDRFHLNFIGTNSNQLKEYCMMNNVKNVTLVGTFNSNDTLRYYDEADVIMNLYGNHTPLLDYALSNKLYYSACLYKPILVCEDTFMEKISKEYGLGMTLRMKSKAEKDALYEYIKHIDRRCFIKDCDFFIDKVNYEQLETQKEILERLRRNR